MGRAGVVRIGLLTRSKVLVRQVAAMSEEYGFTLIQPATDDRFVENFGDGSVNLALLHWTIDGYDALGLCTALRARATTAAMPTIVLSEWSTDGAAVRALNAGADDYRNLPISSQELAVRIGNVHARPSPSRVGPYLIFQDIVMDLDRLRVFRAGRPIELLPTEFRVLRALMESPEQVLSKERLVSAIRGSPTRTSVSRIQSYIIRLRRELARVGSGNPIRTVRGMGYILEA